MTDECTVAVLGRVLRLADCNGIPPHFYNNRLQMIAHTVRSELERLERIKHNDAFLALPDATTTIDDFTIWGGGG